VDYETIAYSVEDRVATITFNRPDQLNAINLRMQRELEQAFAAAEANEGVWMIVVSGSGPRSAPGPTSRRSRRTAGTSTRSRTCLPSSSGRLRRRPRRRSAR